MARFEDLDVWKDAKTLSISIYQLMSGIKDYGFRDQIQRAAISIMNNIAEGSEYGTEASFVHFLSIARGSCAEVRSMLYVCSELGYCSLEQRDYLINLAWKITASINKLITYFKKKNETTQPSNNE